MEGDRDCVFCAIVHGESQAHIIHRDELVTAFLDIHPVNAGHTLVVPNSHAASLRELPDDACGRMFVIGRRLDAAMSNSSLKCDAVSLYLADGRAAGQAVFHTHLHVIPRFRGDASGLRLHDGIPASPEPTDLAAHAEILIEAMRDIKV